MLSRDEFNAFAKLGYNRIPVVLTCLSDLDTPLSVYLKLAHRPNSFLLESVEGGERSGRYSFIGLPASQRLEVRGETVSWVYFDAVGTELKREILQHEGDPLRCIQSVYDGFRLAPVGDVPRFFGGLAGYFGYDTIRYIEPKLRHASEANLNVDVLPTIMLLLTDALAVVDNVKGNLQLVVLADPQTDNAYDAALERLRSLQHALQAPVVLPELTPCEAPAIEHNVSRDVFFNMVEKAKTYIAAGDIMQVVLGQRLQTDFPHDAVHLYRALRAVNPSPYLFFYHFGNAQVVGSSPEILVRQSVHPIPHHPSDTETHVTLRPIAGTRPRGVDAAQDAQLAQDLLADPKEIAEHVMLIDLARNDLGRIAEVGTVKVTEQMVIERYSHVMHIVSNVEATLRPQFTLMDVLRATFPAGTLSGAPKVRAMQIIDELEPTPRGVYGGACGYLSFSGSMDLAIAIRTGVVCGQQLYVQAGAGIVADSVPESEWQETENKAQAVMRAAQWVHGGFTP